VRGCKEEDGGRSPGKGIPARGRISLKLRDGVMALESLYTPARELIEKENTQIAGKGLRGGPWGVGKREIVSRESFKDGRKEKKKRRCVPSP